MYLYTPEGIRTEKKRWSIHVKTLNNLVAAQDFCHTLANKDLNHAFIMIDIRTNNLIKFQVLYGNYSGKPKAVQALNKIQKQGFKVIKIIDFKN